MKVTVDAQPMDDQEEMMEEKEYGPYDKWEIESAVRCLIEAEEIKADADKMKYVKMCMDKQFAASKKVQDSISSLSDLKAVAKKKLAQSDGY